MDASKAITPATELPLPPFLIFMSLGELKAVKKAEYWMMTMMLVSRITESRSARALDEQFACTAISSSCQKRNKKEKENVRGNRYSPAENKVGVESKSVTSCLLLRVRILRSD
jgi:hypothetical protein